MRFLAKLNKFLLAKKMVAGPTTPIQNMVNAVVPCGLMLLMFSSETLIAKMSMMRTQYMVTPHEPIIASYHKSSVATIADEVVMINDYSTTANK